MARRGPANTTFAPQTLRCRIIGCRWRFAADGRELRWWCERGCPSGGRKTYDSPADAERMATRLDRPARPPLGILSALAGTVHRERKDREQR